MQSKMYIYIRLLGKFMNIYWYFNNSYLLKNWNSSISKLNWAIKLDLIYSKLLFWKRHFLCCPATCVCLTQLKEGGEREKEGGWVDSVTDLNTRWINRSPVCSQSVPSVELTPRGIQASLRPRSSAHSRRFWKGTDRTAAAASDPCVVSRTGVAHAGCWCGPV